MTRRLFALAAAAGAACGFRCGYKPRVTELRWVRYKSWQEHRHSLHTAFLRGWRSDGAVFTVAGMPSLDLTPWLNDYLAYPMARGDAWTTGKASGYRS
jgi:hypothetical protein